MPPVVAASNLTKEFPEAALPAVDSIDFEVGRGECFGFLGPNGAGKTTTMGMISCRVRRTGGELSVLGYDPTTNDRVIKSRLGVVPQETNIDSMLSVAENLLVYARYFGISSSDAIERGKELLDFVQLGDRAGWNVELLSGGMKRRLLIARSLINQPDLVILDEPTTGLDPQARHLVWEKLRALRRRGVTLVLTTHYMDEAAQLCDRLVIMHQGKILVTGSPTELIRTHVAPEVVELTAPDPDALAVLTDRVARFGEHEVSADRVLVHTGDGEKLLQQMNEHGIDYESASFRRAGLEEVFLKLTGRRLEE